jgi:hypothetical protein
MTEQPMEFVTTETYSEADPARRPLVPRNGTIFTVFLFLKGSQYALYFFGWILLPSAIFQWTLTIIASVADFWFTKNLAGRLILGIRWSTRVTDSGDSQWVFEYVPGGFGQRSAQRYTFWLMLTGAVGLWALFSSFSLILLRPGWLFVTAIGLSLAFTNAWGFWKCDKTIAADLQKSAVEVVTQRLLPLIVQTGSDVIARNAGAILAGGQDLLRARPDLIAAGTGLIAALPALANMHADQADEAF